MTFKRMAIIFLLMLVCQSGNALAQNSFSRLQKHTGFSESPYQIRMIAQQIFNSGEKHEQYKYDYLAEALYVHISDKGYIDALSWAAKTIGQSKSKRYERVLKYVINTSPNSKLKRYANDALLSLTIPTMNQYDRGGFLKKTSMTPFVYSQIIFSSTIDNSRCHAVISESCSTDGGSNLCMGWHKLSAASKGANTVSINSLNSESFFKMTKNIGTTTTVTNTNATYFVCSENSTDLDEPKNNSSIESRLHTLKNLHEQGLINIEDYQQRKMQILQEI